MFEILKNLFASGLFIPHGHCYLWKPGLVWLHVVSDLVTALAYYSIPLMLVYLVHKRHDVPFHGIFLMFGAFIIACGTTHVMEVWTLWYPTYWLSGSIKMITAIISLYTALELGPLIPKVLALPSPAQLEATNLALKNEITERKRAEAALRESEERFKTFMNNSPVMAFMKDEEGRYVYVNEPLERVFNVNQADLQGKTDFYWMPEATAKQVRENDIAVFSKGKTAKILETVPTPDGSLLYWLVFKFPVREVSGQRLLGGVAVDITDRQQAESALLESQTRLLLINSISTGITSGMSVEQVIKRTVKQISQYFNTLRVAYSTIDRQGNLSVLHSIEPPGMAQITGLVSDLTAAPEYLNALRMFELVIVEDVATSNRFAPLADVMKAGDTRAVLDVPLQHLEQLVGLLCFDSPSPRKWSEHEIVTLREVADYLAVAIKQAYEQQQRQRVESALRESERRFRAIFDQTFQFVGLLNPDGTLLEANQTALDFGGLDHGDVINRPLWEARWWTISSETQNRLKAAIASAATGKFVRYEVDVLGAGNTVATIDFSLKPVKDETGQVVLLIPEGRNITDRKRAESKIKASLQEKEVLLKEIHHRVKNNLQIIESLLRIQSRYTKDEQAFGMFKESQNRIKSMALIHEKLYQSTDLARINFADYIQSLTASLFRSYSIHSTAITLKTDVADVFLSVDAAIPCGLIINELVANSLKHAFPQNKKGEIHICLRAEDEHKFMLIVSDNGIGLPKDLDFRNTESLGLQLVTSLAEQLKATIELHSHDGTEFRLTFIDVKSMVEK